MQPLSSLVMDFRGIFFLFLYRRDPNAIGTIQIPKKPYSQSFFVLHSKIFYNSISENNGRRRQLFLEKYFG